MDKGQCSHSRAIAKVTAEAHALRDTWTRPGRSRAPGRKGRMKSNTTASGHALSGERAGMGNTQSAVGSECRGVADPDPVARCGLVRCNGAIALGFGSLLPSLSRILPEHHMLFNIISSHGTADSVACVSLSLGKEPPWLLVPPSCRVLGGCIPRGARGVSSSTAWLGAKKRTRNALLMTPRLAQYRMEDSAPATRMYCLAIFLVCTAARYEVLLAALTIGVFRISAVRTTSALKPEHDVRCQEFEVISLCFAHFKRGADSCLHR